MSTQRSTRQEVNIVPLTLKRIKEIKKGLLPLPRKIQMQEAFLTSGEILKIYRDADAHRFVLQAAEELIAAFQSSGIKQVAVEDIPRHGKLKGLGIVLDSYKFCNVKSLPSNDQGYIIEPLSTYGKGLVLKGTTPIGTLYAARTLIQLIQRDGVEVIIPCAKIKDWPDLPERGVRAIITWHPAMELEQYKHMIDWMAAHKLNVFTIDFAQNHIWYKSKLFPELVDNDYPIGQQDFLPEVFRYGKKKGIKMVALCFPLDYLFRNERQALKLAEAKRLWDMNSWFCLANDDNRRLLKSLICEAVDYLNPDRLEVTMSESFVRHCQCTFCREKYFVKEMKMYWDIFSEIKNKRKEPIELANWTSWGCEPDIYDIISSFPKNIITHHSPWDLTESGLKIIRKDLQFAAEQGYRLLWMPEILPFLGSGCQKKERTGCRESYLVPLVEYFRKLSQELTRNNFHGLVPRHGGDYMLSPYNMNHAALAEFSWNSTGRTTEELLITWAYTENHKKHEEVGNAYAHLDIAARHISYFALAGFGAKWKKALSELPKAKPKFSMEDHFSLSDVFPVASKEKNRRKHKSLLTALKLAEKIKCDRLIYECKFYDLHLRIMQDLLKLSELRCLQKKGIDDPETVKALSSLKFSLRNLKNITILLDKVKIGWKEIETIPFLKWGNKFLS